MANAYQQSTADAIIDFDGTAFRGTKSDCDPSQLPLGYIWNGINVLNVGGVLSCRPGFDCKLTLPAGRLQGAALFRPVVGVEQILFAVDGKVYVSPFPFVTYRQLPKLQFLPYAEQIFWETVYQSAERINESLGSAITLIPTKTLLFMQDGGNTAPAWFDGNDADHIRGNAFDTPAGGPMVWVGDRLWIATRNFVQASDISNPFSFRENVYLGGNSAFYFSGTVTGMVKTPSVEAPQLMVFTALDASILQANIRQRDAWPTTPDFQREVVQVGAASSRSIRSHYGQIVWMSPTGIAIFDPATAGKLTARLPARDNEMLVSKSRLSDDLSLVAGISFGQFFMMSVPADDQYNTHTWVLNHASFETLNDDSGPSWSGYWIGTRPVEWVAGVVADVSRIYHVSVDYDGVNRLWEAFRPNRLDNGCPITCGIEGRGMFGQTSPATNKLPGARCRLTWSDFSFAGIEEDLDVGVFYAGGSRGQFKQIMQKLVKVSRGSLKWDRSIDMASILYEFKAQSRTLRTEDANKQVMNSETAACPVEREDNENIDESFQFAVVWHGPATLRWSKSFGMTISEKMSGEGDACSAEEDFNSVRFDGAGVKTETEESGASELAATPAQYFVASKTKFVEQDGITTSGAGFATSVVSQGAADRVANIIAQKQAERELQTLLPFFYSQTAE
jgi:hypothetical protein